MRIFFIHKTKMINYVIFSRIINTPWKTKLFYVLKTKNLEQS